MKAVAIIAQKGGAGKTTLAVHLAVASCAAVVLDADPQGSARAWRTARDGAPELERDPSPVVAGVDVATLDRALASIGGRELVIIDTPPRLDLIASTIARRADFLLIPCRPSALDFAAVGATAAIAKATRTPAAFVISAAPLRAPEIEETRLALEASFHLPVAPVVIHERRAFARAIAGGRAVSEFDPEGKAALEIKWLWQWLKGELR